MTNVTHFLHHQQQYFIAWRYDSLNVLYVTLAVGENNTVLVAIGIFIFLFASSKHNQSYFVQIHEPDLILPP